MMLTGPIPATTKVLEKTGLTIDEIDLFEVNEAFASVITAWRHEHGGSDPDALGEDQRQRWRHLLGHPLGASGAKLLTSLVHELQRTGKRYGTADHVRGRRDGQRVDHRADLKCTLLPASCGGKS